MRGCYADWINHSISRDLSCGGGVLAGFRRNLGTAILGQLLSLMLLVAPTSLTAQMQLIISHDGAARLLRRDIHIRGRTAAFCQLWILTRWK